MIRRAIRNVCGPMDASLEDPGPILLWFRQDLRLADNPALQAALGTGRPVIPVFIERGASDGRAWGGASRWWLDKSLAALDADLRALGSRLILRRGDPVDLIRKLAAETGAVGVFWNRLYGPAAINDGAALTALRATGLIARSHNAGLLIEPWSLRTAAGKAYRVFTPFWRAARAALDGIEPLPAPRHLPAPEAWPASERLEDWRLHPNAPDWSGGFSDWRPGEAGARARLDAFVDADLAGYRRLREHMGQAGGSRLSPHLHWGEIGPRQVWAAAQAAAAAGRADDGELDRFLFELGWREFNHHLLFEIPDIARRNIDPAFDRMAWRSDPQGLEAWREGRTGYPLVDAGMRELWATGFMHNRARMAAASFLTKHLLIDWREGEAWFWDTLVDADEANNPANWQWVAGSGADAAPYFRIFNPVLQGEHYDPDGDYVRRWIPELRALPGAGAHQPWLGGAPDYPQRIVDHRMARERALEAYARTRSRPSGP
jgi:deoxyribodipyrimidine photo-lyase